MPWTSDNSNKAASLPKSHPANGSLPTMPSRMKQDYASPAKPSQTPSAPRRPDWLVVLMIGLFLLTLLIIYLVDIPALLR